MFKKKKPKGALVKAATTIGKTAGKLVAVVDATAEKAKTLTTKKSKAKVKRKTAKKAGVVSKIKGLIAKSKK